MRIITAAGDIPYKTFTFNDGQPHVVLLTGAEGGSLVTIETSLTSPRELFDVLLVKNILDAHNCCTSLNVRYLLGARMDRPISPRQPHTLAVIAKLLLGAGFRKIRALDPHSAVAHSLTGCIPVLPTQTVDYLLQQYHPSDLIVIAPDAGATSRVEVLVAGRATILQARKRRDAATGALSGFAIDDPERAKGKACLILDDICDGGGTFTAIAEILNNHGAASVDLFVTHGIFSKGLPLKGICTVYSTSSYPHGSWAGAAVVVLPCEMPVDLV